MGKIGISEIAPADTTGLIIPETGKAVTFRTNINTPTLPFTVHYKRAYIQLVMRPIRPAGFGGQVQPVWIRLFISINDDKICNPVKSLQFTTLCRIHYLAVIKPGYT